MKNISEMSSDQIFDELKSNSEAITKNETLNDQTTILIKRTVELGNEYKRRLTDIKKEIDSVLATNN